MNRKKRLLYPGAAELEAALKAARETRHLRRDTEPDFIGGKPNYSKFNGRPAEQVLVWLNID